MKAVFAILTAAVAATTAPAWAQDDAAKPLTVTLDNYATYDNAGTLVSDHELDFLLQGSAGDWSVSAEAWAGIERDWTAGTTTLEIPTLELSASSEKFGQIWLWDTDPALESVRDADGRIDAFRHRRPDEHRHLHEL